MPTFYDPVADAEEASQALRGLAHASRDFAHPEDAYTVMGNLLSGVRSLQQSLAQIAQQHNRHEGRAFDDHGDQAAGIRDAHQAAGQLFDAAAGLDAVEERLNLAMQAAGRIAWHPAPGPPAPSAAASLERGSEAVSRWVNIVFLQGEEADAVLSMIDRHGPDAAIEHLSGFDYGTETTDAAMENGYVYDTLPAGPLAKEAVGGEYTLTYNPDMGHVGLYRRHPIPPEDRLDPESHTAGPIGPNVGGAASVAGAAGGLAAGGGGATGAAVSRSTRALGASDAAAGGGEAPAAAEKGRPAKTDGSWFTHPGVAAVKRDRGLGL